MNKITTLFAAVILMIIIPMKSFAQPTRIADNEPTISFDITTIANFDERIFFLYNLTTDGRFEVITSENDGIFVVSANEAYESMNLAETFADFREQNAIDFLSMEKEQAAETAAEYKGMLPLEFTSSLMMDYYIRSRQNNTCANADPFCTDNGMYEFPAGVNAGSGESGPYYACLYTTPNPAWYYMRILNPGSIDIYMYSTPSVDIDFCCWGPFTDPTTPCPNGLTSNKVVSCSYAAAHTEHCMIPASSQTGEYYILVITNYSNQTTNISFSKVGGNGTTDCGILPPLVDNNGPYCVGETIYLTANGQAGATYSWTGPGGFTSNQQNPTRPNCTMAMAGTYTCTIALGGATNSAPTDVEVFPMPTANFNFTTVCVGDATQFTNTSTTNPSGQSMNYLWNFGDGQTSTLQSPSHPYTNAGTYSVTLTVTTGGHCTSTKTQSVTVYAEPAANAGPDQTIPYGSTAQLSGSGGAGTFNFHWEPNNMVTNPNAQNTQTVALTQDQTYTLTVTNPQGGCTSTDEVTIHINGSAMMVTAGPNISICQGGSGQIYVNAGGGTGNITYSWTPTTGLSNPNIYNPIASPSQTTTYTCHVSDGQTSQDVSVTVTVNDVIVENEYISICPDVFYPWHGNQYNEVGTYQFDTVTDQGCDKTVFLHLDHYPAYDETTISEAICEGETFTFYGEIFDHAIQTMFVDHTIHGCDSIVRLNLTVYPFNDTTIIDPSICIGQTYNFHGTEYDQDGQTAYFDTIDNHGCLKVEKLILSVGQYQMPAIQNEYICYGHDETPYFRWDKNNMEYFSDTYDEAIVPDPDGGCDFKYRLNLKFHQEFYSEEDPVVTCDEYRWPLTGEIFHAEDQGHHIVRTFPYDFGDKVCDSTYILDITINTQSILEDKYVRDSCDTVYIPWFGQDTTFTTNTVYTFTGLTDEGCYREQTYHIENMKYTPNPGKIKCSDALAIVFGDTIAVVTNTEFFSFQYTFNVEENNPNCVWNSCKWEIDKPSWTLGDTITEMQPNGKYWSRCTVYVADRQNEYVTLTATIDNGCGSEVRKFYLKSSFLDVDESELVPAKVDIVPNPNNGQMRLDFENMEGRTAVKVFDMTGNQIDAFETTINSNRYNYDYSLKKHADGIYFFVISNNNRVLTKKVVIIR